MVNEPWDNSNRIPSVDDCRLLDLPKISDPRGNLTFVEGASHVPFDIQRVYYLYDVPGGADRGGHAHRELEQFMIAISGSFDVVVDDGKSKKRVHMNRSYYGLYMPKMIWRVMDNFSSGAVCLVLALRFYKRIVSHLSNIATTVVMPVDLLDFHDEPDV